MHRSRITTTEHNVLKCETEVSGRAKATAPLTERGVWQTVTTQTPGRIHNIDPPQGSVIYTIGILESRIRGSILYTTFYHTIYHTLYHTIYHTIYSYYTILFRIGGSTFWILPGVSEGCQATAYKSGRPHVGGSKSRHLGSCSVLTMIT